jgi:hypothetical protein
MEAPDAAAMSQRQVPGKRDPMLGDLFIEFPQVFFIGKYRGVGFRAFHR